MFSPPNNVGVLRTDSRRLSSSRVLDMFFLPIMHLICSPTFSTVSWQPSSAVDSNCAPFSQKTHLLHSVRRLSDRIDEPCSLVCRKLFKSRHHMRLRHVDIVSLGNARRTVSHQAGQRELVHSALCARCPEGMAPAIELEVFKSGFAHCPLVGMLHGC